MNPTLRRRILCILFGGHRYQTLMSIGNRAVSVKCVDCKHRPPVTP